jgi:YVTN family beta-propeller protein
MAALLLLTVQLASCSRESEDAAPEARAPAQASSENTADAGLARQGTDEPGIAIAAAGRALPDGASLVYVTNEDSNSVSVIAGQSVIATIPVGKRPRGIKVSPDGSRVYVALSGSPKCPPTMEDEECEQLVTDKTADGIAEVDVLAGKVLRILPSGSDPEQFDVNWDSGTLYTANEDIHMATFLDIEAGEILLSVSTGLEPEGVRLSPDASVVYVTGEVDNNITVFDADSGEELTRIPVGLRPRDIIFTQDGSTAYVSAELASSISVIDTATRAMTREIALPEGSLPMGLVLSENESKLFVSTGRGKTVVAVDLGADDVVNSVEVGARPWGLASSLDGRFLYSANGSSDDVTVIDTDTFQIVTKIPVGETPWGVAVGPFPD